MSAVHTAELLQGSMGVAGLVSRLKAQWTLGDKREGVVTMGECYPPPLSHRSHRGNAKACWRADLKALVCHQGPTQRVDNN